MVNIIECSCKTFVYLDNEYKRRRCPNCDEVIELDSLGFAYNFDGETRTPILIKYKFLHSIFTYFYVAYPNIGDRVMIVYSNGTVYSHGIWSQEAQDIYEETYTTANPIPFKWVLD